MSDIKLVIQGKKYTVSEARELYYELHALFGNEIYPPISAPYTTPIWWYKTTSSPITGDITTTTSGTREDRKQ